MARYLKPPPLVSRVVNPVIATLGLKPALATRSRRTGRWRTIPVNVVELDGHRYLVSPRGATFWARNLGERPEAELRRRGRTERFRAVPVEPGARERVIAAYRARWDNEVRRYFEELPDPADHPVFRLEPA
jgi:deazaflavin-dependent oxidoreductase (nitroreductase family)